MELNSIEDINKYLGSWKLRQFDEWNHLIRGLHEFKQQMNFMTNETERISISVVYMDSTNVYEFELNLTEYQACPTLKETARWRLVDESKRDGLRREVIKLERERIKKESLVTID